MLGVHEGYYNLETGTNSKYMVSLNILNDRIYFHSKVSPLKIVLGRCWVGSNENAVGEKSLKIIAIHCN